MPTEPNQPEEYSAVADCDVAAIAKARHDLHTWLRPRLEGDELVDDVIVVLSELLANACAASDPMAGSLLVRACLDIDVLVLEVANRGSPQPMMVDRPDTTDPLRRQGRGLVIAQSLMDVVEVDLRDEWTIMRCTTSTLV